MKYLLRTIAITAMTIKTIRPFGIYRLMKLFFCSNLVFFGLILWQSPTFGAAANEQCFYKHAGIEKIPGSVLLPNKVCLTKIEFIKGEGLPFIKIDGDPIKGLFELEKLREYEAYNKYMTYIFNQEHQGELQKINVTLRVSVDVIKDTDVIDYVYLAAEFFVPNGDGSYDTHIYYYKRNSASHQL